MIAYEQMLLKCFIKQEVMQLTRLNSKKYLNSNIYIYAENY